MNSKNKRSKEFKINEISVHAKKKKNRKHDNIETHYFGFVQNCSKIVLYHQWSKERKNILFFF